MDDTSLLRDHAERCRALADGAAPESARRLLEMADNLDGEAEAIERGAAVVHHRALTGEYPRRVWPGAVRTRLLRRCEEAPEG